MVEPQGMKRCSLFSESRTRNITASDSIPPAPIVGTDTKSIGTRSGKWNSPSSGSSSTRRMAEMA
jgi:hypothetical protein